MKKINGGSEQDGDKKNMVPTSFRLPASQMEEIKRRIGPLGAPSKIFRVLVGMWLDGLIEVTNEDIEKYG
ncbi:MAG: hypothetical protein H3C36_15700 [Chitinophagaceae bacterium]|nr:hypothetical protein [Chitinophagaceae bacterium]